MSWGWKVLLWAVLAGVVVAMIRLNCRRCRRRIEEHERERKGLLEVQVLKRAAQRWQKPEENS